MCEDVESRGRAALESMRSWSSRQRRSRQRSPTGVLIVPQLDAQRFGKGGRDASSHSHFGTGRGCDVGCVTNVENANRISLPCLSRPREVLNHDLVVSVLFFCYRGSHGLVGVFKIHLFYFAFS